MLTAKHYSNTNKLTNRCNSMSIQFSRTRDNSKKVSLIPLIDVSLFLLIFFMVAGTIEKFELIPIDPPEAESGKFIDEGHITVLLGTHDEIVIGDDLVMAEEVETVMKQILEDNPNKIITIKADGSIKAVKVIKIMERMRAAGGTHISLMTQSD